MDNSLTLQNYNINKHDDYASDHIKQWKNICNDDNENFNNDDHYNDNSAD